mmetsp:Transcript_112991/g.205444  ORF Transcript_112991/g.205444 Transcript_112991/m.205444 type:complete len:628 (-) Transcript_112991:45-1928(-)
MQKAMKASKSSKFAKYAKPTVARGSRAELSQQSKERTAEAARAAEDDEAARVKAAITIEKYERGRQSRMQAKDLKVAREVEMDNEYGQMVIGESLKAQPRRETIHGSDGIYRQDWNESGPLGILHDRKKQEERRQLEVKTMAKDHGPRLGAMECTCGALFEPEDLVCQECGEPRSKENEAAQRKAKLAKLRLNATGRDSVYEIALETHQAPAHDITAETPLSRSLSTRSKRKRKNGQEGIAADPTAREMAAEISGRVDGLEKQLTGLRVLVNRIPEHLKVILDTYLSGLDLETLPRNAKAARNQASREAQDSRQLLDVFGQPEKSRNDGEGPPPLKVRDAPSTRQEVGTVARRAGGRQASAKAPSRRQPEKKDPSPLPASDPPDAQSSEHPFTVAVKAGDEAKALAILRKERSPVNEEDRKSRNAIHWAASRGLAQVCVALLNRHDFFMDNDKDIQGWTALHHAAAQGSVPVVRVLLDHTQFHEVDAVDVDGQTALHVAAHQGQAEACSALLEHPNFNAANQKDTMERTALHVAARHGHTEACRALLYYRRFSEVGAQDFSGYTALDYAAFKGHAETCKVLLMHPRFAEVASKAKGYEGLLAVDLVSGEAERVLESALQQLRAAGHI